MSTPQWKRVVDLVMAVPEQIYERWNSADGWDNDNVFGREFGENGVSWCVIFDWVMYSRAGLASIVPKVDNVTVFSDWARDRGQWSEYPSIGAWVNLSNGGHTEVVVGFDKDTVYTKGGNSLKAGAADNGQGNGVWSHATARRSSRVVGYFAPRFPDGVCPPTADPADPRGGTAVASWRWSGPSTPSPSQEDDMPTPLDVWSYSHGDKPDVHQTLVNAANAAAAAQVGVAALTKKVDALSAPALSDAQLQALADKVAANPALSDAIAAKVAANIAARLES